MKLSIRTKMLFGFFGVIVVFVLAIVISLVLQAQRTTLNAQVDSAQSTLQLLQSLNTEVRTANDHGAFYLMATNGQDKDTYQTSYYADLVQITNLVTKLKKVSTDAQDKQDLQAFDTAWSKYSDGNDESFQLAFSGGIRQAQATYVADPFDSVIQPLTTMTDRWNKEVTNSKQSIAMTDNVSKIINVAVIGLAVVLGIVVALFLSKRITKPLLLVNRQLREISEGEGDLTRTLEVKSKDEIGDLAHSFNQMMDNLRNLISEVSISAQQVASASEELNASAGQTSQATEHIVSAIQEVAYGVEKQAASVEESTRTIEEMTTVVQEIANNAQSVSTSAVQTSELAKTGNDAIQNAITRMDSINRTVSVLDGAVRSLGERSLEIGQIVEVITTIAAQTNLLALNAAIEAARAGEAGRGFAVVADEVRKLAEQSSESAQQIAQLVQTIQSDTQRAVQSMEVGTLEVALGSEAVSQAGDSFEQILRAVDYVSDQIQEVSAASQEMAASASQVVNSINLIAEISATSASGTQNVSAATEEQLASMQEISSTSESLSQMAVELQDLVGRFKV